MDRGKVYMYVCMYVCMYGSTYVVPCSTRNSLSRQETEAGSASFRSASPAGRRGEGRGKVGINSTEQQRWQRGFMA